MNSNYVEMMQMRFTSGPGEELSYSLRPDAKWPRLQRLCFWILDKLGAARPINVERVLYGPFNSKRLVDRVLQLLDEYVGTHGRNPHSAYILLGRDQYRELVSDREIGPQLVHARVTGLRNSRYPEFSGIPLVVVPWMSGIMIIDRQDIR